MLSKLFKQIYLPDIEIFHYKKTKSQILLKLQEVFAQRSRMWSGPDIAGGILTDTEFYLRISGAKLTPVMYCQIQERVDGECTIETKVYAGLNSKVSLYLYVILGFILIITGYSNHSPELSIFGLVIMALGVIIVNWTAYIMKGVVQDRYCRYIHSILK